MFQNSVIQYTNLGYKDYISYIRQYPMLSEEEELRYARDVYENKSKDSAEKLVVSHLKLVIKVAYTMRGYGLALMDLVSEGSIGLMNAVKKFNPNLGYRFATYAKWWIKAYMQEYVMKSWSLVKIGTTVAQKKLFFNLKKAKDRILSLDGGRGLSGQEYTGIAQELSVTAQEVREMDARLSYDISLDGSIDGEEGGRTLLDDLGAPDDTENIAVTKQINTRQQELISEALKMLSARDVDIIRSRHFNDEPETLEKIASRYGISKERVRQLEKVGLEKITKYCRAKYH